MNFLASPWIPLGVMVLLACIARFYQRSWLAPSAFAPLIWSIFVAIPLILAPEYQVSGLAVWLIFLLIVSMMVGAILGESSDHRVLANAGVSLVKINLIFRLVVIFSGLAFAGAIYSAIKATKDYGLDFSPAGLLAIGHFLAVERYSGEQTPLLVRVLVLWVFPAALLGGIGYAVAHSRRQRIFCFLPLLPAFLFSLLQAAKANTLIAVVLGLSGYMAMRVGLNVQKSRNQWRQAFLVGIACLAVGLSFFFIVDALRSHTEKEKGVEIDPDWARAKSTAVSYLSVFGNWVNSPDRDSLSDVGLGAYTFGGLLDMAGLHSRKSGLYEDSVSLADNEDSNIYTAFRGLIEDYTLIGAIVFLGLLGFVSGIAYQKGNIAILAGTYSFLFWSPIVSLFLYNGPIIALVIGALVLRKIKMEPYVSKESVLVVN